MSTLSEECNRPSTSAQADNPKDSNHDAEVVCLSSDASDIEIVEEDSDMSLVNKERVSTNDSSSILETSDVEASVKKLPHLKCLFKNHNMEPLTFIFLLHDFPMEVKLTQFVEECGGVVYNNINDIDGFTIVIVKDESLHWSYLGPVFKLSYVEDCLKSKRILNITSYFKNSTKYKFSDNFNYMSVVYFKKYTWDSVPTKFQLHTEPVTSPVKKVVTPNKVKPAAVANDDKFESSSSDDESLKSVAPSTNLKNKPISKKQVNKHTRMFYSRQEDESILKFIIKKRAFTSLKGVRFWQTMESRDVCPKRTWQSMKERFMKSILYHLSNFKFLEENHIKALENNAIKS